MGDCGRVDRRRDPLENFALDEYFSRLLGMEDGPDPGAEDEPIIQVVNREHCLKKMNPFPGKDESEFDIIDSILSVKKVLLNHNEEVKEESPIIGYG